MAASRFRPPKLNRKSRKGLQNQPANKQVSIRKALRVVDPTRVDGIYTVSGCYCSRDVATRHAKVVLGLADTDNP